MAILNKHIVSICSRMVFKQGNNAAVTVQQACIRDIYIVIYCLCL